MTTTPLSRERIEQYANDPRMCNINDEIRELARMALAAMDSEPVAVPEHIAYINELTIQNILANNDDFPMANAARLLAYEVRFWRSVPLYRRAQPALVVPAEYVRDERGAMMLNGKCEPRIGFGEGWNACRAAMLQSGSFRENTNSSTNNFREIPETSTNVGWISVSERMPDAEGCYLVWANASKLECFCDHLDIAAYLGGEWDNEFGWLVTHWMPLPAAPQEVKP